MGKIAVVFPGQGSQYPGMGKDIYEKSAAARSVFDMAERLAVGTRAMCFCSTAEELSLTKNTQPALFSVDLACAQALRQSGIEADMTAGFSLGEAAALAYGGVLTHEDAFSYVCRRGRYMHECATETNGAMAAVLKLTDETVEGLCSEFDNVYPVNYNCPGQITIAGEAGSLDSFIKRVTESGGRALKLPVSGAFHSPFMVRAATRLEAEFENMNLYEPQIPVYSNVTAAPYTQGDRQLIFRQIYSPVRWEQTIRNMIADGADTFIEAGAGKVLSGLIKRISGDVRIFNAENYDDILNIKQSLASVL